jgi:hypothetical protein
MRIGLHRGRREVPLTAVRCPRPCGSARALEMGRRGLLWSAIGPLRRQHAVVQSGLPSHWDDTVAGCCLFTSKCLIRPGVPLSMNLQQRTGGRLCRHRPEKVHLAFHDASFAEAICPYPRGCLK